MHPNIQYELAKMHIDEQVQQAERERLVRKAGTGRKVRTDLTSLAARARARLSGGTAAVEPRPADAGA